MVATTRTYGELWIDGDKWKLTCEPHVSMMVKRVFGKIPKGQAGVFTLPDTPETCRLIDWFLKLYPLRSRDLPRLYAASDRHVESIAKLSQLIDSKYSAREFSLKIQPRSYQAVAAEVYLNCRGLLLADDVGLGKTCTAICSFTDQANLPGLVVCPAHLTRQWKAEIERFAPDLEVHILRKKSPYPLPKKNDRGPDVIVSSYHMIDGWAETLGEYVRSVIFDEGQELRRDESAKYRSCRYVARKASSRLALTATPIYNYGEEIYNLIEVLRPGLLGSRDEFRTEWCTGRMLKDPAAFGSWLREQGVMLRRTRRDVSRELPPVTTITQAIDTDAEALQDIKDAAHELATIIMSDQRGFDKMQAASELDVMVRRATGIGKAPHVAAFVEMLLDNGEPVVLFGWHRTVYDLWQSRLAKHSPAFYTGAESAAKKQAEVARFLEGQTNLLVLSLRSGAGLDGLQKRCRTVVIGELDWSPGVHEQCVGRVARDGQPDPVTVYYALADTGSDPILAEILGLKRHQVDGLRGDQRESLQQVDSRDGIRRLAESYLARH